MPPRMQHVEWLQEELLVEEQMFYYWRAPQVHTLLQQAPRGESEYSRPSERLCAALALSGFGVRSQNNVRGQQVRRLSRGSPVKRQRLGFVSCAAAVTVAGGRREQTRRGTKGWQLVCASGDGGCGNGGFHFRVLESAGRSGGSTSPGTDTAHAERLSCPRLTTRGLSSPSHLLANNGFLVHLPNNIYAGMDK